jgi:nucleolar pre-ribosomal-associated protein 1
MAVADVAHHFMLQLGTHPGTGICFRDSGWYQIDTLAIESSHNEEKNVEHQAGDLSVRKSQRVHNKILSFLLRTLKVGEDSKARELVISILHSCPELRSVYWSHGGSLGLEPRLSSRWLSNMAFFNLITLLPVPTETFFLSLHDESHTYRTHPPPLNIIMENILPAYAQIRTGFTKGLQNTSQLVRYTCALTLTRCLFKFRSVLQAFREASLALKETDMGWWSTRAREVQKEARSRMPDIQVIIALSPIPFLTRKSEVCVRCN